MDGADVQEERGAMGGHAIGRRPVSLRSLTPRLRFALPLVMAAMAVACGDGAVGEGGLAPTGAGSAAPPGFVPGAPVPGAPGNTGAGGQAPTAGRCGRTYEPARAVALSERQYRNALSDLVGGGVDGTQPQGSSGPSAELDVLDRPWVTTAVLDRVVRQAEAAAESLRGRTGAVLACDDLRDPSCVRDGLRGLAERAFARPVEQAELDALMTLYGDARTLLADEDGESATLLAVQAILAAPSTLYRTEFSQAAADAQRSLAPHERASAIAAFLLDSVPDDPLRAAAEDGSLMTDAGLSAQLARLLELPRVQRHLTSLVLNGYRATRVFESPKDEGLYPQFTPALQASMFGESQRFVDHVLWSGAPLSELLVGTTTFVDGPLAELYGVRISRRGADEEGFVEVELPPGRAGLLTQASVLAGLSRTDKTSVVARGLFVRRDLLCLPKIPPPPASVQAQVNEQLNADATEVDLAAYRAETSPCNGCHSQFDRFGLALEGFDPIGRIRASAPEPIDLTGLYPLMGAVAEPGDLVKALVEDDRFTHCMAERLMDYALSAAAGGDAFCDTDALHAAINESDGTLAAVIQAIVTHPAFSTRREVQP